VEDRLEVVEVPVVVEIPWLRRPDSDRILVREGERVRRVTSLVPLEPGDWTVLVYVDAVLTAAETWSVALAVLARSAGELSSLGPVTVVVSDPAPEVVLEGAEEPSRIEQALQELSRRSLGRDRVEALRDELVTLPIEERAEAAEDLQRREVETVVGQLERLGLVAGERCPGPPCALILVTSGYYLEPEAFYPRATGVVAKGTEIQRATEALAVELAARGWTVLAVPIRRLRDPAGAGSRRWSDYDAWATDMGMAPVQGIRRRQRHEFLPIETLDFLILPRYAPLRLLASSTGGTLARADREVAGLLEGLAGRWLLWYAGEASEVPLPSRPLEILDLHRGRPVRAPAWSPVVGSGPPR
jgi:hypothetical protein